jgi:hypothetical protein
MKRLEKSNNYMLKKMDTNGLQRRDLELHVEGKRPQAKPD